MSQVKDREKSPVPPTDRTAPTSHAHRKKLTTVSIVSGLLGFLLFLLVPFLPVKQTEASFTWPEQGNPTNLTAPLMSYMPQDIDISIPVEQLTNLNDGQTTIVSTVPETSEEASLRGMFVRSTDNGVDVIVRNVVPLSITDEELAALPKDANLRITSDHESTHVWIPNEQRSDGTPFDSTINDDIRPMLTGIYSEIRDTDATHQASASGDLRATVTVDSRFTSSPTAVKILAIVAGLISLIVALWSLHSIDTLDGRIRSSRRAALLPPGFFKPRPLDAVVGGVLLIWYFIGANTADDGYLRTMAQASKHSGYMANYYRWFGVSESPFGFPFYDLLGVITRFSETSIVMRLPSLIAGIVVWLVLSREILPRLGTRINQRKVAHITMASTFLLLWMVYNNGTRPEPVIAMFSLLAWVSFERAIASHRLFPAAIGTMFATLALSAGPTGLMAVAALLVSLSAMIRILIKRLPALGAPAGAPRGKLIVAIMAQIAPFLAAGTAILAGMFADQTFASVMEATRVRSAIGPSLPWYEEYIRYTSLLDSTVDGSFTRRFAVLMLFFSFGVVIASLLRYRRVPGAAVGPTNRLAFIFLGTMFFMVFTPTKWTHHFGVYAGLGAAVTALAAVAASRITVSSQRNRIVFFGAALMLFALCLSGSNGWWYVGSFGVPWWDKSIQVNHIEASTVMLGTSLIVLVWGVVVGFLSDAKHARLTDSRDIEELDRKESSKLQRFRTVATAPIAALTALVVLFSLASLGKGFVAQWPAYSIGKGNIKALSGNTCLMANDVMVEKNTNESFLPVADGSELKDSLIAGKSAGFDPNNIPTKIDPGTGSSDSSDQTSVSAQELYKNSQAGNSNHANQSDNSNGNASSSANASGQTHQDSAKSGDDASSASNATKKEDTGTTGGVTSDKGINGSYAKLPFGLDEQKVPVIGSFTDGIQEPSYATTKWFTLPARDEQHPLVVFSAAGAIYHHDMNGVEQYGQEVVVEYGREKTDAELAETKARDEKSKDQRDEPGRSESQDRFLSMGELEPLDIGTEPEWRNMRVPMDQIPEDATVIRIRAVDTNLTEDQWVAFTPPRAPELESIQKHIGSDVPTLLDWSVAFQFPCLKPYDHHAGVAEVPHYRVSPSHESREIHTPVMDYYGGGSVGLTQMTATANEMPTYLNNDWQRDWGVLDELTTHSRSTGEAAKQAELELGETTHSGLWSPGPMKYKQK
ncbi:arabinosyltransferase [Corynebacterium sp. zg254]|uniref:Arabinosyltransferase n=1 Tax=Corynebacterium zhongnanshanii TaxID=2768834 RepID=A0ABQ6VC50_9CORY|nr:MULTISPECIES: arabinosyltransferase domain-containing protein [Corynebacterium]KAB3519273.1 arabinosyltransferase [Corynebacterium zhongnanshanii]MCR5915129.1 arabinosyltransferase [Corynebacterium sp. zg254]